MLRCCQVETDRIGRTTWNSGHGTKTFQVRYLSSDLVLVEVLSWFFFVGEGGRRGGGGDEVLLFILVLILL